MTWRMGPSFTMLLALWLVCGSEPHGQTMNRGSRGGQKVPLVSAVNRRPARLLRHTGRSQGIERTTLEKPNLQPLQRRRSIPVLRVAHATAPPASLGIHGAPVRTQQSPGARSSPREMVRDEGSSARSKNVALPVWVQLSQHPCQLCREKQGMGHLGPTRLGRLLPAHDEPAEGRRVL